MPLPGLNFEGTGLRRSKVHRNLWVQKEFAQLGWSAQSAVFVVLNNRENFVVTFLSIFFDTRLMHSS